jgi:hypothetical protein
VGLDYDGSCVSASVSIVRPPSVVPPSSVCGSKSVSDESSRLSISKCRAEKGEEKVAAAPFARLMIVEEAEMEMHFHYNSIATTSSGSSQKKDVQSSSFKAEVTKVVGGLQW